MIYHYSQPKNEGEVLMGPSLPRSLQSFVHRAGCMHMHTFLVGTCCIATCFQGADISPTCEPAAPTQQSLHEEPEQCTTSQGWCWWTEGQFPTAVPQAAIIFLHIPGAQIAEVHPCCFPPRASSTCRQDFGAQQLSQQLHFVSWLHPRDQ